MADTAVMEAPKKRKFSIVKAIHFVFGMEEPTTVKLNPDLTMREMDQLVSYHLSLPPTKQRYLEEFSLVLARVCDREAVILSKTMDQLREHGFVLPPPTDAEIAAGTAPQSPITVNTYIIDRTMVSRLYAVNARVQPRLVSLLFLWEEECRRWAKLDAEERDIRELLAQPGMEHDADLNLALEAVRIKFGLLPSQRAERTTTETHLPPPKHDPMREAELPGYEQEQTQAQPQGVRYS